MKFKEFLNESGSKKIEATDENIKKLIEWFKEDFALKLFFKSTNRYRIYGDLGIKHESDAKDLIEEWNSNETFQHLDPTIIKLTSGGKFEFPPLFDFSDPGSRPGSRPALTLETDSQFVMIDSFEQFPAKLPRLNIKGAKISSFQGIDKIECGRLTLSYCTLAKNAPVLALFKTTRPVLKVNDNNDTVIDLLAELKDQNMDIAEATEKLHDENLEAYARF